MKGRIRGAALMALALAAAGCGGDDDKGPTKAAYIAKADAICKASDAKIEAAAGQIADPNDAEAVKAFVTATLIPNVEGQVKELRALDKPKDDADEIDAIYDAVEAGVAKGKSDPASLLSATTGVSPFADANTKAQAYGMKSCGQA
jgi:hypothetical protein